MIKRPITDKEKLDAILKATGMTRSELAKALEVGYKTVYRWIDLGVKPHPAQAKGLFGYLFATESAWLVGQNDCALISLLQDIPRPEWVPALGSLNVARIDPEAAWRIFRSNTGYLSAWGVEQAPAAAPQSQPHAALDLVPQP